MPNPRPPPDIASLFPPRSDNVNYYRKCIGLTAYTIGLRLVSRAHIPGELLHNVETDSTLMSVGFKVIWMSLEEDRTEMLTHIRHIYDDICGQFTPEDLKDIRAGAMPELEEQAL